MIPFDPSPLTFVAIQAALQAGDILRKGFGTKYEISEKAGIQNLVTQYDSKSEKHIIDFILEHFPDHAILAEESGSSSQPQAPVLWVVDPLDGTVNYAHNIPVFTVSIAAAVQQKIVTGVVYQPITQELFVAELGQGSYLNGTRLQVSKTADFKDAMMATGFPYDVHNNPEKCVDRFSQMTKYGIPIRRLGSAALDLAYVAAGKFDAYWELSLQAWDIAAGKLLVEEAGGTVTKYDGSEHTVFQPAPILATNGLLHEKMIKELTSPL
jgi:myo-inositol-1(or 4)-monophosphatase